MIDRWNPHIDHFDFGQLLQHRRERQPWGVQQQTMLQGDQQAVGQKGDQNVSVGAMLQLMLDGAYAEFTLERAEDRFDLRQLHVARPQDAGISGGQVGAQQVVPVAYFCRAEFFLVHTKLERFPRYLLAFPHRRESRDRRETNSGSHTLAALHRTPTASCAMLLAVRR